MCDADDRDLFYEPIAIPCPHCAGDGGFEVWTGYDPRDGSPTGYTTECSYCGGTGDDFAEVLPIDDTDLDRLDEDGALPGEPTPTQEGKTLWHRLIRKIATSPRDVLLRLSNLSPDRRRS